MRNFQSKRAWRDIFQSKPVLIFLGIVLLFFSWNVLSLSSKMRATSKNRETAEAKVAALKEQKEKLALDIEDLKTDQGKERIFRENFGMAKAGEDVIIVVEDKNLVAAPVEAPGFFSFLFFWKNWFK